jgi:peptidoglycan/xylan/chitin deacetylase (PgdA/CDA1 family)
MFIEQIPNWIRRWYPNVLWRKSPKDKTLYLTFDDGPTSELTPWILNQLDALGIKATFFCIGSNAEKHPELLQEIKDRGHAIGLHGYNHVRGLYKNTETYFADIEKGAQFIDTKLFRPPHGRITPQQAKALAKKYIVVLWDVITRDYNASLQPEQVEKIALKYTRNGSIIVFHDSLKAQKNMQYAFPRAVKQWLSEGYTFATLND